MSEVNVLMAGPSTSIEVSIEQLLDSRLIRDGADLSITSKKLSGDNTETSLLKDYFINSPDLATTNGILKGNIVNLLAINSQPLDHGMIAFEDPQAIGKITTADGAISVQRLDQTIQLNEGDFIYLNDIINSNTSAVGIAFADETTMSVDPNSTMVIDDFVYDPEEPTTGSMNANVLVGNFSFVSGQIAKVGNDAMKVTTPVLTIGVRGTQVAGKANTNGEDNEIVLLPNEDGSVGQIMIKNEGGEVLLTKAYEATTIFDPYTVPTVPVILAKAVVLKKFASTIATTRKTEKIAKVERDTEEAVKEKEQAEEEKEELGEEKEELEEEKEELEEEAEELEEEKEKLEEEKEELEEKVEELEEEKEEVAEEKEEIEEKLEEVFEEKEQIEEKKEEVVEEIEELEEKLEDANIQERQAIEKELEKLEEEFEEIEEEVANIEEEIQVVAKEKVAVEKKVREIEKEFIEVEKEVIEVEQQVEFVEEKFIEIEEKVQFVEKEVLQVIEKELVIEKEIIMVEEKFEAIVKEFEIFQETFVQEFEDFIPEEELQQFIEEAPQDIIEEFQENIIEKLEEQKINVQTNENEVAKDEEPEDIFSEENVEKAIEELDEKQEELIEEVEVLLEKDMELQEQAKELDEKAQELEKESQQLEEAAEEAYANNDREAIEEIEQEIMELEEEFREIDDSFQKIDEQYQELDQQFEEVNEQFVQIDEEFSQVIQLEERLQEAQQVDVEYLDRLKNDYVKNPELKDWERELLEEEIAELEQQLEDNGPMYNEDNDVFSVPEELQVDDMEVEQFIQEEKEKAIENNVYAQEAEDFFENEEVIMNEEVSDQVQDLFILNTSQMETYIDGTQIDTAEEYYEQEDEWSEYDAMLDYNEQAFEDQLEADDWFDQWIADLAEEQNINVAPWLDMPRDLGNDLDALNENTAVNTTLGYVYGSDANGDQLTYSIFSDPSGKLAIDGSRIYLASPFSVTQDTTYNILLKVTDPYGASDVDEWQIIVEDNHSPSISTTSAVSLAENVSVGTAVATISSSDAENEDRTYSITAGNTGNAFTIDEDSGAITTAAALDYETTTSYTLTITVTDDFGNTSTANQVVNVTDVNETTQYTKAVNTGTLATWGTKFSEDTVQDNSWTQKSALIVSNSNTYSQQSNAKTYLEAEGFTVTEKTIDNIMDNGYSDLKGYSTVFELNWSIESHLGVHFSGNQVGAYSSDLKNAFEDYLQSGGSLYKAGELTGTGYSTQNDNAVNLLAQIGGNLSYTSYKTGTGWVLNSDYRVGPTEDDTTFYSLATAQITTTDGSYMTNWNSNSNIHGSAEWGPNVLNNNIQGTMMTHHDFNYLGYQTNYSEPNLFKTYANWLLEENEDNSDILSDIDSEYIPIFGDSGGIGTTTAENDITAVESFHLGNNVYIGGGYDHIDFVWDDAQLTATYVDSYSVSSQETGPRELAFSSDGTKFFVTGYQGNDVGEYHMSTAWDVSTASYDSAFSVNSQESKVHGLAFNTDGTKMFVSGYEGDDVNEYTLSTGWDVSTASHVDSFSVSSQDTEPRGLAFSTNGTKMFMSGNAGNTIEEYTLTTGFDVSTASHTDSLSVSSYDNDPRGIAFNDDGTEMFYHGQQNDKVHHWTLSTAWDISTGTYNSEISLPSFDTGAEALVFSSDGDKLFVSGNDDNTIDEYTLSGGWDDVDLAYWAFNADMDGVPQQADDHYGVIGYDKDGDGDLWETTDTFNLDKIKIHDDSADFLKQDSDASGDYYLKVTPVTYAGGSWTVETDNTVTVTDTAGYNAYLDLSSNTDFDDINYALIETESALISEVVVSA